MRRRAVAPPRPVERRRAGLVPPESRRLRDCVRSGVRVLFVGINPGMRSAATGHHFAGPSNRFWKLLYESGVVPTPITHESDRRLPEWGLGVTNLVPRATPGIDTLDPDEYRAGLEVLRRKIRRWQPRLVVLVGLSLYRAIFGARGAIVPGLQTETLEGVPVFVLPNPSGRNAHFSYPSMLAAFKRLARELD